ncbi:MAG TPA: oligopeptide/dipeptide ABC transporter ATP-binding protein [Thermoplasmata archaeon]|nr:oligopeptide/dipeptide ABC transporter ATP-binding protein [Thermoplasmata archaeon]
MDGISFDIRKGEVLCLVGESGCGKTSTGRAILKLTEATGGDVFLEIPGEQFNRFQEASSRPDRPESAKIADEIRRKYSITWRASIPWTGRDLLTLGGLLIAAVVAGFLLPSAAVGFLSDPFTNSWVTTGFGAALGALLGAVAGLPPGRPWRRLPLLVALLSLALVVVGGIPTFFFAQAAGLAFSDPTVSLPWERDLFGMLMATALAPICAAGTCAFLVDLRARTSDIGGIRMKGLRRRLQLIFQDPYESLNPKQSVYEILAEPLQVNHVTRRPEETTSLVMDALRDAGLRPPEEFMFRFPHELSGGQRQRVSIAAALVLQPDFIVADEPVSMLDVSIRTGILQLMMDLRESRGLTYLFITHDLGLAWIIADRIAVMYLGKIVEIGTAEQVIRGPKHPYTQALISVVPSPDPRKKVERVIVRGERPDAVNIPAGCRFHPRCPFAFERCGWTPQEVADQLRSLDPRGTVFKESGLEIPDARTLRIAPGLEGPEALARDLRGIIAGQRETSLALKGIAEVRASAHSVDVILHESEEPELLEIGPGNSVACHLVTERRAESVTAGAD